MPEPRLSTATVSPVEPIFSALDRVFMQQALEQAAIAASEGEVPVGAVLVCGGAVIATGRNACIASLDPTAHAEMQALRAGAKALGNYRLTDCTLYVTLEPCAMCSGAALQARLGRLVFGALEPKTGAAGSVVNVFANVLLNHQTHCSGGLQAGESAALLQNFFKKRRQKQAQAQAPFRLRPDALRTPESAFALLPNAALVARHSGWTAALPSFAGLRMHFLDGHSTPPPGEQNAQLLGSALCLHGTSSWSSTYAESLAAWSSRRWRLIAPDLFGFGKSDKPKKRSFHTLVQHRHSLVELMQDLKAKPQLLVVERSMLPLALGLIANSGQCFKGLLLWAQPQACLAGWQTPIHAAPFPDAGYQAGALAFADVLQAPDSSNSPELLDWGAAVRAFDQSLVAGSKPMALGLKVTAPDSQPLPWPLLASQDWTAFNEFFGFV